MLLLKSGWGGGGEGVGGIILTGIVKVGYCREADINFITKVRRRILTTVPFHFACLASFHASEALQSLVSMP